MFPAAFLLGDSAFAPDREEDVPLGVLVPDGLLPDDPVLDLPAAFSWDEETPSLLVVLGLEKKNGWLSSTEIP